MNRPEFRVVKILTSSASWRLDPTWLLKMTIEPFHIDPNHLDTGCSWEGQLDGGTDLDSQQSLPIRVCKKVLLWPGAESSSKYFRTLTIFTELFPQKSFPILDILFLLLVRLFGLENFLHWVWTSKTSYKRQLGPVKIWLKQNLCFFCKIEWAFRTHV